MTSQLLEVLLLLSTSHLFGLYNPNQAADALTIPKAKLYRVLKAFSLYQWKCLKVKHYFDFRLRRTRAASYRVSLRFACKSSCFNVVDFLLNPILIG